MSATLRKWWAVFGIYFQEGVAYRASGVIWVMTDLVTGATMPLVWVKATQATGEPIGGFTAGEFVVYYLVMLLVGCFVTSHIMWELATEIKDGQFSMTLMRPMSVYQLTFLRSLSWRVIRPLIFLPFAVALYFAYRSYLGGASIYLGWELWVAVILGHLVSFNFVYMMAMLALFVQEAMALFELYYVPMLFLSGSLFPIAVLPDWARVLALAFPFYFTTGVPTEIAVGRLSGSAAHTLILGQLAWIVGTYLMGRLLWKHGLKHYTAVGM